MISPTSRRPSSGSDTPDSNCWNRASVSRFSSLMTAARRLFSTCWGALMASLRTPDGAWVSSERPSARPAPHAKPARRGTGTCPPGPPAPAVPSGTQPGKSAPVPSTPTSRSRPTPASQATGSAQPAAVAANSASPSSSPAPMRRHAARPDETVMGRLSHGSHEVTDVEPGDVQRTGPLRSDRRIASRTARRRPAEESDQPG